MKCQYELQPNERSANGGYFHRYINMRHPRTTAERREIKAAKADGTPYRAARNRIPQFYDDNWPALAGKRSWKTFTRQRHQWRVVTA